MLNWSFCKSFYANGLLCTLGRRVLPWSCAATLGVLGAAESQGGKASTPSATLIWHPSRRVLPLSGATKLMEQLRVLMTRPAPSQPLSLDTLGIVVHGAAESGGKTSTQPATLT